MNKSYPTNIVIMGSGEPLLNYDETLGFLKILNNPDKGNIGARKITVSTIGIPDKIMQLADEGYQFELALSLHHPDDTQRQALIPIAEKYPLASIIESLIYYTAKSNRLPTFEYCIIDGINDSPDDALQTARLAKRTRATVNIIPYNKTDERFTAPSAEKIIRFKTLLDKNGVNTTVRTPRGADIDGACGQLRAGWKESKLKE